MFPSHTQAHRYCTRLCYSVATFPRLVFQDVLREYTRSRCVARSYVCVRARACMWCSRIHSRIYPRRRGGRGVTRQGFNGILFTGFVPRLGKHSVPMPTSLWTTILLRVLLYIGPLQERRYLRDGFLSCILGRVFLNGEMSGEITVSRLFDS